MPLGRDLQQQIMSERADVKKDEHGFPEPSNEEQKETVANMLGLMGSNAVESIMSDIEKMIDRNLRSELDGYVLALSRIMRHDLAWQCIVNIFGDKNLPIPHYYFGQFGKTPGDLLKKQRQTVL